PRASGNVPFCLGVHPPGCRAVRLLLRPFRADWPAGPDHHPDRTEAGLLLPLALRPALAPPALARDTGSPHRTGPRHRGAPAPPIPVGRRGEELAPTSDRGPDRAGARGDFRDVHAARGICSLEAAYARLEWRSPARALSAYRER